MLLHSKKTSKNIEELDSMILKKVNDLSVISKDIDYKMYCGFSHIFD